MNNDVQQPVGQPGDVVIQAGRRLGIEASAWLSDWYISHSPRNGNSNAEGTWAEWVALAHQIIELEAKRQQDTNPKDPT